MEDRPPFTHRKPENQRSSDLSQAKWVETGTQNVLSQVQRMNEMRNN